MSNMAFAEKEKKSLEECVVIDFCVHNDIANMF